MTYIYPLNYLCLLAALSFYSLSFLIFIRKKPLVINAICVPFIFIIELIISYLLSVVKTPAILDYLPIMIFFVVAALIHGLSSKGIIVYGVTYAELYDKIVNFLNTNKIEFEHSSSNLYLKKHNIKILCSHNDKYAYARIIFEGKNTRLLINKVISELRQRDLKVNRSYSIVALICGIILTITYFFVKHIYNY
ncbi:MAG: hypothetical protein Q8T08_04130 [Ignavibacteria bacterium]|nr:hypothetical protein [Ignavibacteria bacterium]